MNNLVMWFRNMIQSIRDFLWVLQAYLRGKVLRQWAYRPQGNCFQLPVPVNTKRILTLIRWWGFRLATLEEAQAFMDQRLPKMKFFLNPPELGRVPHLRWDDAKWCDGGVWNPDHRFLTMRR